MCKSLVCICSLQWREGGGIKISTGLLLINLCPICQLFILSGVSISEHIDHSQLIPVQYPGGVVTSVCCCNCAGWWQWWCSSPPSPSTAYPPPRAHVFTASQYALVTWPESGDSASRHKELNPCPVFCGDPSQQTRDVQPMLVQC